MTHCSGIAEIFVERVALTRVALAAVRERNRISTATSVFLSHTTEDKPFVRRLAGRLREHGVRVWLDEAELKAGQSLLDSIGAAIDEMRFLIVVLSHHSIASKWVLEELKVALTREFAEREVVVIPILAEDVQARIPAFLRDKLWIDFRDPNTFELGVARLIRSIGAAEPLAELMASLKPAEIARDFHRCAIREVEFGRQLIRQLSTNPACDIPANRRWLFWKLAPRVFSGRYPGSLEVGWDGNCSDGQFWRVDITDELLSARVVVRLPPEKFDQGVWEFNADVRDANSVELSPEAEQRIICRPSQFVSEVGFGRGDQPSDPLGPEVKRQMAPIFEDIQPAFGRCTPEAQRSMLRDLYALTFKPSDRSWRAFFGRADIDQCSTFRPDKGRVKGPFCTPGSEGTLFFEVYDSFFSSANGLMLCSDHRNTYWDVEFDFIESHYNLKPLGPH